MADNPVQRENRGPGTDAWLLDRPAPVESSTRAPAIEGYCSSSSIEAGEVLSLFVSTAPASEWSVEIYRTGYYGGLGGRLVLALGPYAGAAQPAPPVGPYRVRACRWEESLSITIPDDWLSGVYLGKLTEHTSGYQSYLIFIVKDRRDADLIVQCSDLTWQAYNRWPDAYSLYDDGVADGYYVGPGVGMSFDRPYGRYRQLLEAPLSTGSGEWLLWEFPFAHWAEKEGYDVTYVSNLELHSDPGTLERARGFVSVGHDEYYTLPMFENLDDAVRRGLNVAFLSGNTLCGRLAPVPSPPRSFVRTDMFAEQEPAMFAILPTMADLPFASPDSKDLLGSRSTFPVMGGGDWTCVRPEHWIYSGTGMEHGDGIPGLVGWESHGLVSEAKNVDVVAAGPVDSGKWGKGRYAATVYEEAPGNAVFNAATIYWADGLSEPPGYLRPTDYVPRNGPDPRVQAITGNVLGRFVRSPRLREQGGAARAT